MKALTLHQPWASLVALGVKTIETRSWSTKYRGQLVIHAGRSLPPYLPWLDGRGDRTGENWTDRIGDYRIRHIVRRTTGGRVLGNERTLVRWPLDVPPDAHPLPLGSIVATCNVVDVVPIIEVAAERDVTGSAWVSEYEAPVGPSGLWYCDHRTLAPARHIEDQRPYGDFTPGRYAWLLDDVKPTTERCPACCGAGGEPVPTAWGSEVPRHRRCEVCAGRGSCDPIPTRGRQGLWEWTL